MIHSKMKKSEVGALVMENTEKEELAVFASVFTSGTAYQEPQTTEIRKSLKKRSLLISCRGSASQVLFSYLYNLLKVSKGAQY